MFLLNEQLSECLGQQKCNSLSKIYVSFLIVSTENKENDVIVSDEYDMHNELNEIREEK